MQSLQVNHNLQWGPQSVFAPALISPNLLAGLSISSFAGTQSIMCNRKIYFCILNIFCTGNIADTVQGNAVYGAALQSPHNNNLLKHQNSTKKYPSSSKVRFKINITCFIFSDVSALVLFVEFLLQ